ncbi:MAG: Ig-like domain-containing protein [Pseudomonadota bacterium]
MKRSLVSVKAVLLTLIVLVGYGCGGSSTGLNESASTLTLTANPVSIIADNISFSTITAVLIDGNGKPSRLGTAVAFATNLGVFSNNKNKYDTLTVDEKGTATATLIAGLTPGTATVTCTSGSASAIVKIEIKSF